MLSDHAHWGSRGADNGRADESARNSGSTRACSSAGQPSTILRTSASRNSGRPCRRRVSTIVVSVAGLATMTRRNVATKPPGGASVLAWRARCHEYALDDAWCHLPGKGQGGSDASVVCQDPDAIQSKFFQDDGYVRRSRLEGIFAGTRRTREVGRSEAGPVQTDRPEATALQSGDQLARHPAVREAAMEAKNRRRAGWAIIGDRNAPAIRDGNDTVARKRCVRGRRWPLAHETKLTSA